MSIFLTILCRSLYKFCYQFYHAALKLLEVWCVCMDIVEGEDDMFVALCQGFDEGLFVEPVAFSHKSLRPVAVDSKMELAFGCHYEHLYARSGRCCLDEAPP